MRKLFVAAVVLFACGGGSDAPPDAATNDAAALDAGGDATSPSDAAPSCTANVDMTALGAHDTSAFAQYDQAHFSANFGTTTWIAQSGTTMAVDPAKADMSLNPVTPGHVSNVDVHTLIPSRPDLRWFAHITPWFRQGGGSHIDIGLEDDSDAYVQSMVDDMRRRGFDGVIVDWYGQGSYEDSVTLRMQKYIDSLPPKSFTFIVMMDKGISGLSESVLEQQISYVQTKYFADPNYELEGGQPILMFFGVTDALGSSAMQTAKTNTGGNMVWVVQGTGSLSNAWDDQAFDWTHDWQNGPSQTDPYNLAGVKSFYSAMAKQTKKAFGSLAAGFNGTLTKSVSWSKGKYLPRGSGACIVQWSKAIDGVIPANVTRMQWATWSDWEEGTEIESGVENDAALGASIAGSKVSWTITTGTGDESTIDHYEVFASQDGKTGVDVGAVSAGTHSFDLASAKCPLASGTWHVTVDAVAKPNIRDHLAAPVDWIKPS
ncbi:MAG TPA: hypothetical protein VGH28_21990 [Polyangiaceae bacterium]|jgi:hypothetical protein